MQPSINPWSSGQSIDTKKLFEEFGIEPIGPVLGDLPEIPTFMRRGVVIGHRDYGQIATAIREKRPFHVLTGFMPSGHPHLGHLMVMKEVVWHIRQGGQGTITIADCEAHAVRGSPGRTVTSTDANTCNASMRSGLRDGPTSSHETRCSRT